MQSRIEKESFSFAPSLRSQNKQNKNIFPIETAYSTSNHSIANSGFKNQVRRYAQTQQRFLCIETPSFSQTLKMNQTVDNLQEKVSKIKQLHEKECDTLFQDLRNVKQNIGKTMEDNCEKIQALFQDLKTFQNYISSEENCQNSSKVNFFKQTNSDTRSENSVSSKTLNENQLLEELKARTISPNFDNLRQNIVQFPTQRQKKAFQNLEINVDEVLSPVLTSEQKESHDEILRLVNYSNFSVENLQTQIINLNKNQQDTLFAFEDTIQIMKNQFQLLIDCRIEQAKRQNKIIEQLIQKMIYKMTYL